MTLTRASRLPRQRGADFADRAVQPAFHFFGEARQGGEFVFQFGDARREPLAFGFQFGDALGQLGGLVETSPTAPAAFSMLSRAVRKRASANFSRLIGASSLNSRKTLGLGWKSGQPRCVSGMSAALDGGGAPSLRHPTFPLKDPIYDTPIRPKPAASPMPSGSCPWMRSRPPNRAIPACRWAWPTWPRCCFPAF